MEDLDKYVGIALAVLVPLFSAISAAFPDSKLGPFAKIINTFAMNWGNAKNDPAQAEGAEPVAQAD